ncbi:MAG: NmrA family NAD(P)-binding protein [Gemmatimonadaceae bacterium]|nr:NmrA family NAD(P)-binding protein [Gemmatimonadaceae bacterium]
MRILVTTPTGKIGSRILSNLLDSTHDLTVLARDPAKLTDAVRRRSSVVTGNLEDEKAVRLAVTGVDTAFLLVPPPGVTVTHWRAWIAAIGTTFAAAATSAGVSRIVLLSSTGAQHDDVGPVSGLGDVERLLSAAFANVTIVRAGYFMENLFGSLPTIASQGAFYGVSAPDTPYATVATSDIGDVAARWLADSTWTGHHIVGAHGPTALSPNETASVLSDVLGRPVQYVQIPAPALRDALLGAGLPALVANGYEDLFGGMARHLDAGDFSEEPFGAAHAGPTALRTFAERALRPALHAQVTAATV